MDLASPNGVSEKMTPTPTYKASRVAISMLALYRLTQDERVRQCFLKLVDYQYRFQLSERPVAYQSASGMYNAMASLLTGDAKYLRIAWQSVDNALFDFKTTLAEDLAADGGSLTNLPWYPAHFNYFPFVSLPVLMQARLQHPGALAPLPLLRKHGASTANAWAVFEKQPGQPVELSMNFKLAEAADVQPVVYGPDGKLCRDFQIAAKERLFKSSVVGESSTYWLKLILPADLPAGDYRVGQADRGNFAVLDANVERLCLECPEGFWLSMSGIEAPGAFFFHVPEACREVEMFVSRPLSITRGDGSPAAAFPADTAAGEAAAGSTGATCVGRITLPAPAGTAGDWKISSPAPAYVRLLNLPPVAAYLAPGRLFAPPVALAAAQPPPALPPAGEKYVAGVVGGALQLSGGETLRFKRGTPLPDGSYENFPGLAGTIEFWFRPNWSALDQASAKLQRRQWELVSAGPLAIYYLYGQVRPADLPDAFLSLACGRSKYASRGRHRRFGNMAGVFPKAGEWLHIAGTWEFDPQRRYPVFFNHSHIFINGRLCRRASLGLDMLRNEKLGDFELADIPEWITLGGDGAFDELRISGVARYTEDFTPPRAPFTPDEHTKLLMHFDEPITAGGAGGRPVEWMFGK